MVRHRNNNNNNIPNTSNNVNSPSILKQGRRGSSKTMTIISDMDESTPHHNNKAYFLLDPISEEDCNNNNTTQSESTYHNNNNNNNPTTMMTQQQSSYLLINKRTLLLLVLLSILIGFMTGTGMNISPFKQHHHTFFSKIISPSSWIQLLYNNKNNNNSNKNNHKNTILKKQSTTTMLIISPWRKRLATRIRNSVLYDTLRTLHRIVVSSRRFKLSLFWKPNLFTHPTTTTTFHNHYHRHRHRHHRRQTSNYLYSILNYIWPWTDWSTYDTMDIFYLDYESPLSSKRYASTYASSSLPSLRFIFFKKLLFFGYYDEDNNYDNTFMTWRNQNHQNQNHHHSRNKHLNPQITTSSSSSSTSKRQWTKLRDAGTSHPLTFALLREMIRRQPGGYVHPDLGLLLPAPSGASRGLGMVRDSYNQCQIRCIPGIQSEKVKYQQQQQQQQQKKNKNHHHHHHHPPYWNNTSILHHLSSTQRHSVIYRQQSIPPIYSQEEVLLKIPLNVQMTRIVALQTLSPLIPPEILQRVPLLELDDAILLALLLAHEAMKGKGSIYWPYILSLPMHPSCATVNGAVFNVVAVLMGGGGGGGGVEPTMTTQENIWASLQTMGITLGMDIQGWFEEILKAGDYIESICENLARNYGPYIATTSSSMQSRYNEEILGGMMREIGRKMHSHSSIEIQRNTGKAYLYIQWALCHVMSRAIGASSKHGALRLVPLMDMINHNVDSGNFVELVGIETLEDGHLLDAVEEEDYGAFVVRSVRLGRRKPLKRGQELLVNYNVPQYSPLDWFLNMGFVPPERSDTWELLEPVLPKVHRKIFKNNGSVEGTDHPEVFQVTDINIGSE